MSNSIPKEGDLYKILNIGKSSFIIRYGYYSEEERSFGEPIPILPDFTRDPEYDSNGFALATYIQDACPHYRPRDGISGDGWCSDCIYYPDPKAEIDVCQCIHNRAFQEEA